METKKEKIVSIMSTMGIILMFFGATYAYFASRTDAGKVTDIEITANTVDVLTFSSGDSISINLNQENFGKDSTSKTGETYATAMLSANDKTNLATETYNVYLNIDTNTFDYTSEENKPEILLKIVKNGVELVDDDVDSLNHYTVYDINGNSVTGFDITNQIGIITLAGDTEISTTSTTTDEWKFYVTFVNYDFNQSANGGKSFIAKIQIGKSLYESCSDNTLTCTIARQYDGTQGTNGLYYHSSNLKDAVEVSLLSASDETNVDGLYYNAGDNSYRYAGANPNNFVCFGSYEETCPSDNLYRIIGIFNKQIKLIKWDFANSNLLGEDGDYRTNNEYGWSYKGLGESSKNTGYINSWEYSKLNTINLNTNYLNNIGSDWADKIAETTWKVGGNDGDVLQETDAKTAYINEILEPSTQVATTYKAKIGLMYVSDYYYAAPKEYWSYKGLDYAKNEKLCPSFCVTGLDFII